MSSDGDVVEPSTEGIVPIVYFSGDLQRLNIQCYLVLADDIKADAGPNVKPMHNVEECELVRPQHTRR